MQQQDAATRFEQVILPHLPAAYNLARWLTRSDHDAEDVVQESCLRAFRFLDSFRGTDARAWLLAIVRRASYTWLQRHRADELAQPLEEETAVVESADLDPQAAAMQHGDVEALRRAIEQLPAEYRAAVVLRDLEGLSYKQIGEIEHVPIGTVMSRLSRARERVRQTMQKNSNEEP